jgi:hypothetical protein
MQVFLPKSRKPDPAYNVAEDADFLASWKFLRAAGHTLVIPTRKWITFDWTKKL